MNLDNHIKKLPSDIRNEIFSYIIPYSYNIIFKESIIYKYNRKIISKKYEVAALKNFNEFKFNNYYYEIHNNNDDSELKNDDDSDSEFKNDDDVYDEFNNNGLYLFRIPKKNGKHRYYITEIVWYDIEDEDTDYRPITYSDCKYISKYVGKNIDYALLILMTDPNILKDEIKNFLNSIAISNEEMKKSFTIISYS
jgi:hypothetical protein